MLPTRRRAVRLSDELVLVMKTYDWGYRSEGLLLYNQHILRDTCQHGRFVKCTGYTVPSASAVDNGPFRPGVLDV